MAGAMGWVACAAAVFGSAAAAMPDAPYFLSAENPVANVDQRDLEDLALRLSRRPDVQAACSRAAVMWRRVTDRLMLAEQMSRFDAHISDYCFKSVLVAADSDANFPRVLRVYSQAAHWFGRDIPASKWGGDNPDNAYRILPIAAGARYEITGRRQRHPSTYVTFQLVGNSSTSETLGSLEERDMRIGRDGSYVLTLDSTPAGGRPNHMQIKPGAMYLFIRDSMADWSTQAPDALRVRRLTLPDRQPLTEDELAARAVRNILGDVFYAYYASRLFFNSPQAMNQPEGAGSVGGLVSQIGSQGHFHIADDEAVIITASAGGATYRSIVLHDLWLRSLEYRDRQVSLNNAQMSPDADGRFTYVIAHRDPGIQNWLDTTGLHDVLVLQRWQGFPTVGAMVLPTITSRIVKFSDIASELPGGVARVTPTQRQEQLARRAAGYDRRFLDH